MAEKPKPAVKPGDVGKGVEQVTIVRTPAPKDDAASKAAKPAAEERNPAPERMPP